MKNSLFPTRPPWIIADNIRITEPEIARALEDFDPHPIRKIVQRCVDAGADGIDINSGPLSRDPERKMVFLVETVREMSQLPIFLDTANPAAIEAGLRANPEKTVINAFSLEPGKLERILPLSKKFNVDIIGYLLYSNGHVPPDEGEMLSVAVELHGAVDRAGIDPARLIIDPIIAPITWDRANVRAMEVLSVIRNLPDVLGFPVRTIAALSNLTSAGGAAEQKRLLEKSYLPMLLHAGLDMVMMNLCHDENIRIAKMCRALMGSEIFCWQGL